MKWNKRQNEDRQGLKQREELNMRKGEEMMESEGTRVLDRKKRRYSISKGV